MSNDPTGQPPESGASAPPDYLRPTNQTDWIQHSLNQISAQLGRLDESVNNLKETIAEQKAATADNTRSINKIFVILAGAAGAGTVIAAVVGILIDNRFDEIMAALTAAGVK